MSNSYIQVPPDGAGKKVYTTQQIIDGVAVQIQNMNIVSDSGTIRYASVDSLGSFTVRYNEGDPILGSYGDLKVLEDNILGVYEHTVDSYDDLFTIDEISGGTSTFMVDESSVILAVTNDPGSKCTRMTNRYHYYQPGISFLVILAVSCGDSGKENNKRQWGLFDKYDGTFFELSGSTLNICSISNGVYINQYSQSSWNIDSLDGTGPSGINIDVTMAYQYFIAINYPSNIVTYGIYVAGRGRVICHKMFVSGLTTYPRLRHISLPIAFNNENIGMTGSISELREIMSVVITEGDPDYTFWRFADLGCSHRQATLNTPIFSIRPKILLDDGNRNHINSYPESLSIYCTGSTIKLHIVSHNGSILSGDTFSINSAGGPLEADITATSIDINSSQYWIMRTYFIEKDMATNIDLTDMYEINDEGCLLGADDITQNTISYVATAFDGVSDVSLDLSYRSLY